MRIALYKRQHDLRTGSRAGASKCRECAIRVTCAFSAPDLSNSVIEKCRGGTIASDHRNRRAIGRVASLLTVAEMAPPCRPAELLPCFANCGDIRSGRRLVRHSRDDAT